MEFLMKYNITEDDLEKILNNNSKGVINNVVLNKKNVCEIVDYFIELGFSLDVIRNLFINQISIFHKTKKELVDAFDEYEMESIIKSLNFDVNTFDMIEF